ncbi:hypothetical protein [Actinophytocola sp. NPDC049390]|uniref:hypothetical protein n=1 Tax=Actinophytocola sp. NPDC049390 TaxID=3363894 RepID=UPI00379F4C99
MPLRVLVVCLLAVLGIAASPAAAQPAGRVDPAPIVAALTDGQQVVRAPGTIARFDEARVREELGRAVRLVVLPVVDFDLYPSEGDDNQYSEIVSRPIQTWAMDRKVPVVVVTGLDVTMYGAPSHREHQLPADFDELRTSTANRDITERLVVFARLGKGLAPDVAEDVEITHAAPVPAPPDRVAELVAALREDPVYNAPGRTDVIGDDVAATARKEYDLGIRVAAFPHLEPGQPVVDYATPLGAAFPDDVVLVLHGHWLDVVAADRGKALAARAFAYGKADLTVLSGGSSRSLLRDTITRLDLLLTETSWGYPQPPPQPRPQPFDVQRTVWALAPWVLVGSAVVIAGAALLRRRRRAATAEVELRAETAAALAVIGDLGARVLAAEESGEPVDPAVAERHATARRLYDQARTSVAMEEVRRVAEEGLELLPEPESEPVPEDQTPREEGPARTGRKHRWLGVPRWLWAAVALGAVVSVLVFVVSEPPVPVTAQARKAVEGLRTTSVYEEPGGPGVIDVPRSRELIGDRAIVLVLLATTVDDPTARTDPRAERCAEIADLVATSVVIVYSFDHEGDYKPEYCVGPEFVNADNPVDPEDYTTGVVGGVLLGTHFRVTDTDRFAEVEEYVYTFDHYTMRDSPNGVPRRGVVVPPPPTPDALQAWQVVLALGGILAGTVALFLLSRGAGWFAGRRRTLAAATRTRAEAAGARLARLADTVLHPAEPENARAARREADLAGRYVLLLRDVEAARTDADLAAVERALTELEEAAGAGR